MAVSTAQVINIQLPPLHEGNTYYCNYHNETHVGDGGQMAIARNPARFKVVMCGRRWGKTTFGVWACVKTSLQGGRTWWVAPTYKIANEGWIELKRLCAQMIDAGLDVEIRESDKQVIFPNRGMVEVRTSDVEGSLRGAGLDGVVIDEAANHRESIWVEELRPALIDKRGWALFIGTPKGNNWFAKLYTRAETNAFSNWAAWKRETWDNPFISPEERKEIEEEYTGRPDKYRQEILADIGASQFLVYPQFNRDVHMWKTALPEFISYYGGLDFGGDQIGSHMSAGVIAGLTKQDELIIIDEFEQAGPNVTENQINWIGGVEARLNHHHRTKHYANAPIFWAGDKSQMKFLDVLKTYGYRVNPNKGNTGSVRLGVDLVAMRLALRDGKPKLYYMPQLINFPRRMENYHNYEPRDGDIPQRDNPVKVDDDLMDAARYMIERLDSTVVGDPSKIYRGGILGKIA